MSRQDQHPLRGGLALVGGTIAGLGVGLAMGDPAPGLLGGLGIGMVLTAFLRAYGRW
ncbi:MAG: hypothetical protein ACODAE_06445 [Gemmatimonadota bacterium]